MEVLDNLKIHTMLPKILNEEPRVFEHVNTYVFNKPNEAAIAVAGEIAELIKSKAAKGQNCILGLATGSTPKPLYAELVRLHKEEGLSFKNVISFNLDEYYPMEPEALQSYVFFMKESDYIIKMMLTYDTTNDVPGTKIKQFFS